MNLTDALHGRRTTYFFKPEPLPAGALVRAAAAANMAPCHRLTFPWAFIDVGPETRAKLADLLVSLKAPKPGTPVDPAAIDKAKRKVLDPAAVVAVTMKRHPDPETAREDYAATACAIQNFSLSLWGEGVGCQWGTGPLSKHAEGYRLLGVDPATHEIVGILWCGIPDKIPAAAPRPSLDAILTCVP